MKNALKSDWLNGEMGSAITSPSQHEVTKPATSAGFGFMRKYGDKMGTVIKYVHYKPAAIYRGKKWFVFFSFRNPLTEKFERIKVYEDINRIHGLKEKNIYAKSLKDAINSLLKKGFNPFQSELKVAVKNWTFIQGVNYFKQKLETRGLRKRTIQSYQSAIRMIYSNFTSIHNLNIKEITRHQVEAILIQTKEKQQWKNSTYNNNLTLLRAIFNYLIDADVAEKNPAQRIKMLHTSITRNRYFSAEVFKKIKKKSPPDLFKFIMFLYHTGTRPNEARQLKYEHILRDRKLLFIPASISKNKKDGYIPATSYILENFAHKEGMIFGTSVNHFTQKFNTLKKQIKLASDYTLYSIKHTRAIHMAQDGADPYAIMQLFRHSGLDITMSYLRDLGLNINHTNTEKGIIF